MLVEKVAPAANQPESRTVGQPFIYNEVPFSETIFFAASSEVLGCISIPSSAFGYRHLLLQLSCPCRQ
eukprot:1023687-Pelagomonas_calceolata.AAC.1